jgi:hypothetical protein
MGNPSARADEVLSFPGFRRGRNALPEGSGKSWAQGFVQPVNDYITGIWGFQAWFGFFWSLARL